MKVLSFSPSWRPVAASARANAAMLPEVASAIAYAASFAETTISESSASAKVHRWPCFMLILLAGCAAARALTVIVASGESRSIAVSAVMILVVLAGW